MRTRGTVLALTAILVLAAPAMGEELVDRVVAVVDEDPILLSDVRRAIELGLVERRPEESREALERRVLDGLIAQRLRLHEVERHGTGAPPADAVEAQLEQIRASFADRAAYEASLRRLGLTEETLRVLVGRQLRLLIYVEERLGPRVFVDSDEIRAYYDDRLVPELGEPPPPFDDVRDDIRALLREERLNQEIEAWTAELRAEADVTVSYDRDDAELPPVVRVLQ